MLNASSKSEKIVIFQGSEAFLVIIQPGMQAEWELEKLKGEGPMIDQLFEQIDASDRTYEEVIEFLSTTK